MRAVPVVVAQMKALVVLAMQLGDAADECLRRDAFGFRSQHDRRAVRDFASTKSVSKVARDGATVVVDVQLGYPAKSQHERLRKRIAGQLANLGGVGKVTVNIDHRIASHSVQRGVKLVPGVKNIGAVA